MDCHLKYNPWADLSWQQDRVDGDQLWRPGIKSQEGGLYGNLI